MLSDRLVDCFQQYVMSAHLGLVAVVLRFQMRAEGVARRRHMFANVALDPRATFRACFRVDRAHERDRFLLPTWTPRTPKIISLGTRRKHP